MPRRPRNEVEAGISHVWARGNNKQLIYVDDRDRGKYLALLAATVAWHEWNCLGYCLMGNHVHLLVETTEPNLGTGMRALHGDYARWFNKRHERTGHLFGDRFGSKLVTTDEYLRTVVRYIALNPVEAMLCVAAEDWNWSSHAAVVGATPVPPWLRIARLTELLSTNGDDPLQRYLSCVTSQTTAPGASPTNAVGFTPE